MKNLLQKKSGGEKSLKAAGETGSLPKIIKIYSQASSAPKAWQEKVSIIDLFDDGEILADALVKSSLDDVAGVIQPELIIVKPGVKCVETGIDLWDIWRFMRYFWSIEHKSVPGRSQAFMIRNRARPFSPIMGIGMLASPVVQFTARDEAIGWSSPQVIERIASGKHLRRLAGHYWSKYRELWDGLYTDDFLGKKSNNELPFTLTKQELDFPNNNTISEN